MVTITYSSPGDRGCGPDCRCYCHLRGAARAIPKPTPTLAEALRRQQILYLRRKEPTT